jgi:hypothetical protein
MSIKRDGDPKPKIIDSKLYTLDSIFNPHNPSLSELRRLVVKGNDQSLCPSPSPCRSDSDCQTVRLWLR